MTVAYSEFSPGVEESLTEPEKIIFMQNIGEICWKFSPFPYKCGSISGLMYLLLKGAADSN